MDKNLLPRCPFCAELPSVEPRFPGSYQHRVFCNNDFCDIKIGTDWCGTLWQAEEEWKRITKL